MDMLQGRAFSARRTTKYFSRTAVDITLEQTVNAVAASRYTGMSSFIHSENSRRDWMVTRSVRSAIVGSLLREAGLNPQDDVTEDLRNF